MENISEDKNLEQSAKDLESLLKDQTIKQNNLQLQKYCTVCYEKYTSEKPPCTPNSCSDICCLACISHIIINDKRCPLCRKNFSSYTKRLDLMNIFENISSEIDKSIKIKKGDQLGKLKVYKDSNKKYTELTFENYIYKGETVDGIYSGQGQMIFQNGNKFSGSFEKNLFNGLGTMKYYKIGEYKGNWEAGKKNYLGSFSWENGDFYEGKWKNDLPHGKGKLRFSNGREYEGNFENGRIEGEGIIRIGKMFIKGDFRNGVPEGKVEVRQESLEFMGELLGLKLSGYGKLKEIISDIVINAEGIFSEGNLEKGQVTTENFKYTGELFDNVPHGEGEFKLSNGEKIKGFFKNGVYDGLVKQQRIDGTEVELQFEKGVQDGKLTVNSLEWKKTAFFKKGIEEKFLLSISNFKALTVLNDNVMEAKITKDPIFDYEGSIQNGLFEGFAILNTITFCYQGYFSAGLFNGYGMYRDETIEYSGEFVNGFFEGVGEAVFIKRKDNYIGNWKQGKRDEFGIYETDELRFEGYFKSDECSGIGVLINKLNGEIQTGNWKENKLQGMFHIQDGSVNQMIVCETEGQLVVVYDYGDIPEIDAKLKKPLLEKHVGDFEEIRENKGYNREEKETFDEIEKKFKEEVNLASSYIEI